MDTHRELKIFLLRNTKPSGQRKLQISSWQHEQCIHVIMLVVDPNACSSIYTVLEHSNRLIANRTMTSFKLQEIYKEIVVRVLWKQSESITWL